MIGNKRRVRLISSLQKGKRFMKKNFILFVLLMSALLIAASALPVTAASVYTAVTPANTTFDYSLELRSAPYHLDANVTYTLNIDSNVVIMNPSGVSNTSDFVTGFPVFSGANSLTYTPAQFEDKTDHKVTNSLTVDWSNVEFYQPGVYYWTVTKTKDASLLPTEQQDKLTNNYGNTILIVYVLENNGYLSVQSAQIGLKLDETSITKITEMDDLYEPVPKNLTITKTVTGNLGSKDQYFEFKINLTLPANVTAQGYDTDGDFDNTATVQASPYYKTGDSVSQPGSYKRLHSGVNNEFSVWLKHGQSFVLKGLPVGTSYKISESADGYTTTSTNAEGELTSTHPTAAFINDKTESSPTGMTLETGAPVIGLLLGLAFLTVAGLSRRKKQNSR